MAQIKRFAYTNPSSAVALNLSVGFEVAKIEIWDLTTPNRFEWTADMADDSIFVLGTLAYTTSNGVTPLEEGARFGSAISAVTNANPGVITVADTASFGFAVGDTIKVTGIAESGAGATLNADYVIASLTATTITTATNTTSGGVWVSGGFVSRVSDTNGVAIATDNVAIRGVTLGTSAVGANSASMVAICYGEETVT